MYGYDSWRLTPGPPLPVFLMPIRDRLAQFIAVDPDSLAEALVTEYSPGAGIGWHRDAPAFGSVAAISLVSACRMRFRHGKSRNWETGDVTLEPRAAYALTGTVRSEWQHSIPATAGLRYSVTFGTLRQTAELNPE